MERGKRIFRNVLAGVLMVTLIVSLVPILTTHVKAFTSYPYVQSGELYKNRGMAGEEKLVDGSSMHLSDNLTYVLNIITKDDMSAALLGPVSYTIDLPPGSKVTGSGGTRDLLQDFDGSGPLEALKFGTWTANQGDTSISITIDMSSIVEGDPKLNSLTKAQALDAIGSFLELSCSFADATEDAANPGKYEIALPNSTITVDVADWASQGPSDPDIDKSVVVSGEDVTWTVVYTPYADGTHGGDAYPTANLPTSITDELPLGMKIDDANIQITVEGGATTTPSITKSPTDPASSERQTVTIPLSDATKKNTIVYKTKLNMDASDIATWQTSGGKKDFTNSAQLTGSSGSVNKLGTSTPVGDTETAQLDPPAGPTVNKAAVEVKGSGTSRSVVWKLTVNPRGASDYTKFKVVDAFGAALDPSSLTTASLFTLDPADSGGEFSSVTVSGQNATLDLKDYVNSINGASFTITYETPIRPDYFNNVYSAAQLGNTAHLETKTTSGADLTSPNSSAAPGTGVGSGLDVKPLIDKSAVSYDADSRTMVWKIKVGNSTTGLKYAHLVDELPVDTDGAGGSTKIISQRFVNPFSSDTELTVQSKIENDIYDAIEAKMGTTDARSKYKVVVTVTNPVAPTAPKADIKIYGSATGSTPYDNEIPGELEFNITTYLTNHQFVAGNNGADTPTTNDVTIKNDSITSAGVNPAEDTKQAKQTFDGQFINKYASSYDPSTRTITWQVNLNQRGAKVGAVKMNESIPDGLTYVKDSLFIEGESTAVTDYTDTSTPVPATPVAATADGVYKNTGNDIWIILTNVNAQVNFSFKTTIDDSTLNGGIGTTVKFQNNIAPFIDDPNNPGNWTQTRTALGGGSATVTKDALNKEGALAANSNKATYKVTINPYGMDLASSTDVIEVEDILPEGLVIDESSVKIYKATTSGPISNTAKDKDFTNQSIVTKAASPESITPTFETIADNKTKMTITINDKQPYVIEYNAYVLVYSPAGIKNDISLKGVVVTNNASKDSSETVAFTMFNYSYLRMPPELKNQYIQVLVKKVDGSGAKLSGVKFGLYKEKDTSTKIAEATSDTEDGSISLVVSIRGVFGGVKPSKVYLKEISAPVGFAVNPDWIEINVDDLGKGDYDFVLQNFSNSTDTSGNLYIKKIDKNDSTKVLENARFGLYTDSAAKYMFKSITTGADGIGSATGLQNGKTYYLKELTSPTGYKLDTNILPVEAKSSATVANAYVVNNEKSSGTTPPDGGTRPTTPAGGGYTPPTNTLIPVGPGPVVSPVTPDKSEEKDKDKDKDKNKEEAEDTKGEPEVAPAPQAEVETEEPIQLNFDIHTDTNVSEMLNTDGITTPITQTMNPGDVPTAPSDVTIDPWSLKPGDIVGEYKFEGWYADPEFTIPFDFSQPLTENATAYAKWSYLGVEFDKAEDNDTGDVAGVSKAPGTGDSYMDYLWMALMIISATGLLVIAYISRKSKRKE